MEESGSICQYRWTAATALGDGKAESRALPGYVFHLFPKVVLGFFLFFKRHFFFFFWVGNLTESEMQFSADTAARLEEQKGFKK